MVFATAAAVLCCCTSPWNRGLRLSNYASYLWWSYGDSNPRPLACHADSVRRSASVGVERGATHLQELSEWVRLCLRVPEYGGSHFWLPCQPQRKLPWCQPRSCSPTITTATGTSVPPPATTRPRRVGRRACSAHRCSAGSTRRRDQRVPQRRVNDSMNCTSTALA